MEPITTKRKKKERWRDGWMDGLIEPKKQKIARSHVATTSPHTPLTSPLSPRMKQNTLGIFMIALALAFATAITVMPSAAVAYEYEYEYEAPAPPPPKPVACGKFKTLAACKKKISVCLWKKSSKKCVRRPTPAPTHAPTKAPTPKPTAKRVVCKTLKTLKRCGNYKGQCVWTAKTKKCSQKPTLTPTAAPTFAPTPAPTFAVCSQYKTRAKCCRNANCANPTVAGGKCKWANSKCTKP